jgi:hypothetical protein
MTEAEKAQYIETLPVGSLLYFNGHTMMYVGSKDGVNYVISALGTASDSVGDLAVKHQYCVALTPLTVRRWSGNTWLHDLNAAVVIAPAYDINDCEITATKPCNSDDVTVTVSYNGKTLYETTNYTYTIENDKVTVTGTGTFTSSKTVSLTVSHNAVTDSAVKATCTKTGLTKGSHCSICGTVLTKQKTVAKTEHTYYTAVFAATPSLNGKTIAICSTCGTESSPTVVYKASDITLSKTSYTYDGKVKKPSVVVKDSKGNVISSKNYTVSYGSGRKAVGTYSVKVTLKGTYSGTKTLSFKIKPQSTTLSSVSAKASGFTVKWKKQATQTTGYQIRYATHSDMSSATTVTVKGKTKTSQTVTGLTAKKKYYVQVRTYKTVDGKNIYSAWSATKTVTTK